MFAYGGEWKQLGVVTGQAGGLQPKRGQCHVTRGLIIEVVSCDVLRGELLDTGMYKFVS
jgi:hypothetical protein